MDIIDFAKIISAIFAGVSVLFAIYTYKRTSDRELYRQFRLSLLDIRNNISELDDLLSYNGLVEFGICISDELRKLMPNTATKQEIIDYLKDEKHSDYIVQAIHLGIQKSDIENKSSRIIAQLRKIPVEHREQFPILSQLFRYLIAYITTSYETATSPDLLISTIFNSEKLDEHLDEELKEISCTITLFRELASWATYVADQTAEDICNEIFESSELIVDELVELHTGLSDRDLRKLSSSQSKVRNSMGNFEDDNIVEEMFNLLKSFRKKFDAEIWDSIVGAKTKLSLRIGQEDQKA